MLLSDYRMIWNKHSLVYSGLLMSLFLILSLYSVAAAQQTKTNAITYWLEPLNLGKQLKIQCSSGSLVEFVADCPLTSSCNSLRMENDTLICTNSNAENSTSKLPNEERY
jgi:hypothetical protein